MALSYGRNPNNGIEGKPGPGSCLTHALSLNNIHPYIEVIKLIYWTKSEDNMILFAGLIFCIG